MFQMKLFIHIVPRLERPDVSTQLVYYGAVIVTDASKVCPTKQCTDREYEIIHGHAKLILNRFETNFSKTIQANQFRDSVHIYSSRIAHLACLHLHLCSFPLYPSN